MVVRVQRRACRAVRSRRPTVPPVDSPILGFQNSTAGSPLSTGSYLSELTWDVAD